MPKNTFFNLNKEKQERIMDAILNEMSVHAYEHININNIIREANIPRGSFYQYFQDKDDMFSFFYTYIAEKKFAYWGNLLNFEDDMPFLKRFYLIYEKGLHFMKDYPKLVQVGKKILTSEYLTQSEHYKQSMEMAINLYAKYIEIDQQKGRIRADIDPIFLSTIMIEMLNRLTINEYIKDNISEDNIGKHVNQVIDIFEKGIR